MLALADPDADEAIKRQKIDESQKIGLIAKLLDLPVDDVEMRNMIGHALGLSIKTHCFYYENPICFIALRPLFRYGNRSDRDGARDPFRG